MSDPSTTFQRLILLAAAVALPGCSVFYELNLDQCKVDADCASISQGMICGTDNICKDDDRGCADNSQCIDENQAEAMCVKQANALRGECVVLKNEQCPQLLPLDPPSYATQKLRNGNPLILGAFTAVTQSPYMLNFDLAATEVKEKSDGLSTQGGTREVLMLACNGNRAVNPDNFDQDLDIAMDHLIKLKVPGVVSGLDASDLKRAFETKGFPANMFFVSTQEADRALPRANNGLLWELLPGGESLARSYRAILERTLAHLQSSSALTGTARIAQVTTPDIRLLGDISAGIQDSDTGIVFNGMTANQNREADNYLELLAPSDLQDKEADLNTQVSELLTFKPHVIISLGSNEFLTKILPLVESQWTSRVPDQARPFYILSPRQYRRPALTSAIQVSPTLRQRVIGVNAPASGDPDDYSDYIGRFTTKYREIMTNYDGFENFYDAAYYLMYAAAAARPLTDGLSMATGMNKLLSGPAIKVGPNDMPDVFNELLSGGSLTLTGLMGPPKFNTAGGRDDAGAVWCIALGNTTMPDVLTYNDTDGTMQGDFPCFTNF